MMASFSCSAPTDFVSLTKAKKVLLTMEQQAALQSKDEKNEDALEKDLQKLGEGNLDMPADEFLKEVDAYLREIDLVYQDLVDLGSNPQDLVGVLKRLGNILGPFMPFPETVGEWSGKRSLTTTFTGEKEKKPEEALHYKVDITFSSTHNTSLLYLRNSNKNYCIARPSRQAYLTDTKWVWYTSAVPASLRTHASLCFAPEARFIYLDYVQTTWMRKL